MTAYNLGSILLFALLIAGCSEEQPSQNKQTPLTLGTDNGKSVALKIPGVGDENDVKELETDANGVVTGTIDRSNTQVEPEAEDSTTNTGAPRPLILSDVISNRFSNAIQNTAVPGILEAEFHPIGWSTDGKFAYAVEPPGEASGNYLLNVYVQDLVTDKILWQDKYKNPEEATTGVQSFSAYWEANRATMESVLKQYGIKQSSDSVLFAGVINNNGDRIDYVVKKTLKGQPDLGNLAMVTDYQVQVTSDKLGTKIVHKEQYQKTRVLDVDVIGYLRGIDEKRVGLLIAGVNRGWEGPPHTTWFKVVGTNLNHGFKQPQNQL